MIAATTLRQAARAPAFSALKRSFVNQGTAALTTSFMQPIGHFNSQTRFQSTLVAETKEIGKVERTLKALDMAMVRQIKADLMVVDANSDGRIDGEELKNLLRKHSSSFSDAEAIEIGELFYAGKAGGSVSIDSFIEGTDHIAALQEAKSNTGVKLDLEHFKEGERHPLGVGRCAAEYLYGGKSHGYYTEEELDVKVTHVQPVTIIDKLAYNAVKVVRFFFDTATGWRNDNINIPSIMNRVSSAQDDGPTDAWDL